MRNDDEVIVEEVYPDPEEVVMAQVNKPQGQKAKAAKLRTEKAPKVTKEPKVPLPKFDSEGNKIVRTRDRGELDGAGFKVGSLGSKLYTLIEEGTHTRKEILEALGGKSSVGVYITMLPYPKGTHPASRNINVVKDAQGKLRFEAKKEEVEEHVEGD